MSLIFTALVLYASWRVLRRVSLGVAGLVLTLAACGGGGDNLAPPPNFPAIGAHYVVNGTFNGQPTPFTGTLLFAHPDSRSGDLQGTATITLSEGDSLVALPPTGLVDAKMTRDSLISWHMAAGAATWFFSGFFEAGLIVGAHSLIGGAGTASGDFSAEEQ